MTKNYESVFLTSVRPNGDFDQRATETRVRSFWPSCDYFPISVLFTNGATNGGLKNLLMNRKRSEGIRIIMSQLGEFSWNLNSSCVPISQFISQVVVWSSHSHSHTQTRSLLLLSLARSQFTCTYSVLCIYSPRTNNKTRSTCVCEDCT